MRTPRRITESIFPAFLAFASACAAARSIGVMVLILACAVVLTSSQTRRRPRTTPAQTQAPGGSAIKYSAFMHASEKHKNLECDKCHKIPTGWTAQRSFPDVADFPDHDSCVRCHRQQFFTRQAFTGTGPAICTVCHVRAAPRIEARFAFGRPNNSDQTLKPKEERQFTIEFPHDKHQNVIALLGRGFLGVDKSPLAHDRPRFMRAAFVTGADDKKPDYNNCTICHGTNDTVTDIAVDSFRPPVGTFKTMPRAHDACFNCHWKGEKPSSFDCAGCHKPAAAFVPPNFPKRISARFSHEGGKGEHVLECTTCHINITRAASLRGLTPDVPIAACVTCHRDSRKTTYPKAVTIEEEFANYEKSGACTYCHTMDVGKKKAPASHTAAAQ